MEGGRVGGQIQGLSDSCSCSVPRIRRFLSIYSLRISSFFVCHVCGQVLLEMDPATQAVNAMRLVFLFVCSGNVHGKCFIGLIHLGSSRSRGSGAFQS